MAFSHHDTSEHDERRRGETVFFGAEHCRYDYVPACFEDERLLCFGKSEFERKSCITYRAGRRRSRAAFCARNDYSVGLGLRHACGYRTYSAFRHKFYADLGARVHIFEVENELRQVLDRVNIVVRRRGNERYARHRMPRFGYNFVHFKARKLASFARFGSLCHFYLYFVGRYQVLRRDAETPGCDLFYSRTHRYAVLCGGKTFFVLTSFASVATAVYLVHGQGHCLVSFLAYSPEAHGSGDKAFHYFGCRFHFVQRYRLTLFKAQEIAQEHRFFLFVHMTRIFLELAVTAEFRGQLQCGNGFGIPCVFLAVLAVTVYAFVRQYAGNIGVETFGVPFNGIFGYLVQADASCAA